MFFNNKSIPDFKIILQIKMDCNKDNGILVSKRQVQYPSYWDVLSSIKTKQLPVPEVKPGGLTNEKLVLTAVKLCLTLDVIFD